MPIERRDPAEILVFGFGTSVATWALGYVCRLPAVTAPGAVLLFLLLAGFLAGGFAAGRLGTRGVAGGLLAGLLAGGINLLVLGSLLAGDSPNRIVPSALLWVPGSIGVAAGLGALGAWISGRGEAGTARPRDFTADFARVAAGATFLLVIAGGVVTSAEAGLAVADWPSSFGYNMFLYPLSRMTGGIYYEHAHRLFGSLVGLTTVTLAVLLMRRESRPWVRRLAWVAVVLVILQGVLGGLRVTGRLPWGASEAAARPSTALAFVHGALGQIFFAAMVALAAIVSPTWKGGSAPVRTRTARADRKLAIALLSALAVQLLLGAMKRHFDHGLNAHIAMAAIVAPLAVAAGLRAWGKEAHFAAHRRAGLFLAIGACVQLILGFGAYAAIGAVESGLLSPAWDLAVATTHQGVGALLLAAAALVALSSYRLLEPEG